MHDLFCLLCTSISLPYLYHPALPASLPACSLLELAYSMSMSALHYQLSQTLCIMAVLAYTSAFCSLVWMTKHTFRLLKTNLVVPEDSAFIFNKSRFNWCRHSWDIDRTVQTDRQTDGFSALYVDVAYTERLTINHSGHCWPLCKGCLYTCTWFYKTVYPPWIESSSPGYLSMIALKMLK